MSLDPVMLASVKKQLPCYDNRKTEEIRIPMMEGETLEGAVGGCSYKLSDITPSLEELNSAVIETEEGTLPISAIGEFSEKILIENKVYILENDDFGFTMAVLVEPNNTASLSKGIYVQTLTDYEAYFVITRTTGELKTIDPKFLPSGYFDLTPYFGQCETYEPNSLLGDHMLGIEEAKQLISEFAKDRYVGVSRDTIEFEGMQVRVALPFKKTLTMGDVTFCGFLEDNLEFGVVIEGDVACISVYIPE